MGLDNYWKLPEGVEISFDPELHLCGGMFSDHGQNSFRGKVYAGLIRDFTGVFICHNLENDEVKRIADMLETIEYQDSFKDDYWGIEKEEFNDLKRMFKKYAEAGAILIAWY